MNKTTRRKIILLLFAGAVLGFSRSPKNYFKILKNVAEEWKEINRKRLCEIVREFYEERLVSFKEKRDGSVEVVLTKEGHKKALIFQLDEMKIKKPKRWDGKWRVVIFDIPEKKKKAREALRHILKNLGFKELQKSVFILPFECEDEINFIVECFEIRGCVRFLRVGYFTNEEQFKLKFSLY